MTDKPVSDSGKVVRKIKVDDFAPSADQLGKAGNLEVRSALKKWLESKHGCRVRSLSSHELVPQLEKVLGPVPEAFIEEFGDEVEFAYCYYVFQAIAASFSPPNNSFKNWMRQSKPQSVLDELLKGKKSDETDED